MHHESETTQAALDYRARSWNPEGLYQRFKGMVLAAFAFGVMASHTTDTWAAPPPRGRAGGGSLGSERATERGFYREAELKP